MRTDGGGICGDGGDQRAGLHLGPQRNVVLVEGAQHQARHDGAHAEARLAQPLVAAHDLRVARLLPQVREVAQQLGVQPETARSWTVVFPGMTWPMDEYIDDTTLNISVVKVWHRQISNGCSWAHESWWVIMKMDASRRAKEGEHC